MLGINGDSLTNGGVPVDYVNGSFSLGNSDGEIMLTDTGAVEVDRVNYDGGPNFPNPAGASMALSQSVLAGDPMTDNDLGRLASSRWDASCCRQPADVDACDGANRSMAFCG